MHLGPDLIGPRVATRRGADECSFNRLGASWIAESYMM